MGFRVDSYLVLFRVGGSSHKFGFRLGGFKKALRAVFAERLLGPTLHKPTAPPKPTQTFSEGLVP